MGFEPMNTGFADQRVSHFATGAHKPRRFSSLVLRNSSLNKKSHHAHRGWVSFQLNPVFRIPGLSRHPRSAALTAAQTTRGDRTIHHENPSPRSTLRVFVDYGRKPHLSSIRKVWQCLNWNCLVTGHDFSRAETAIKMTGALAHEAVSSN